MSSPTQRSLAHARKAGHYAQVVERWVPMARKRIDLCGCIDLIVLTGSEIIGVQACAGASHSARRTKALKDPQVAPRLALWLASGGRFSIHSWAKRGARGERKLWTLREEEITADDVKGAA